MKDKNLWGPSGKHKNWRCEPLSFAYFSLRRQRKVGGAPHRGNASKPEANRACQRKHKPQMPAQITTKPTEKTLLALAKLPAHAIPQLPVAYGEGNVPK